QEPAAMPVGAPAAETGPDHGTGGTASTTASLLAAEDAEGFRARWTDIQTGFVDAPRRAVEGADALVAELMQHLASTFADERGRLERHWDRGDDVPTDNLRDAFQRYRSFFERLLATWLGGVVDRSLRHLGQLLVVKDKYWTLGRNGRTAG